MATLQERLTEAENALHDLQIGKAVVECRDQNGETVRYSIASRSALVAYVQGLKGEIANPAAAAPSGPMRLFF
jgi:hypothetical protein